MDPDANYRAEAQNKFEILLDWLNPGFRLNGESTFKKHNAVETYPQVPESEVSQSSSCSRYGSTKIDRMYKNATLAVLDYSRYSAHNFFSVFVHTA